MRDKVKKLSLSIIFGIIFVIVIFNFYNTFSLDSSYKFDSDIYNISNNYIEGISSRTDVELFYQYFDLDNCSIEVVDEKGNEVKNGYVFNGSETLLYDHAGNTISRYRNIVYGDADGDGSIDFKDLDKFGNSLVSGTNFSDYQLKALDIDLDGQAKINDLVMIDKVMNQSYDSLSLNYQNYILLSGETLRIIPTIKPDKILNQNLIWQSSDDNIARVSDAGVVTAVSEGEVVISAVTMDKKVTASVKIVVDNTVRLSSNEGYSYLYGEKVRVRIRSIDYNNLSCESSSVSAKCKIENDILVIEPLFTGSAVITVYNGNYGSVSYNFEIYKAVASAFPQYSCLPLGRGHLSNFSTFYQGKIDLYISDKEIIQEAYLNENKDLFVRAGNKYGRASVQVKEKDESMVNIFVLDVYDLRIPIVGGFFKVGEEFAAEIVGGNWQNLKCESQDISKATCRIDGNKLIVKSLQKGEVDIIVKNIIVYRDESYECGEAKFLAVMEE